jgi:phosphate transport system permease protein
MKRSTARVRRARAVESVAKVITGGAAALVVALVVFILGYILYRGIGSISWEFLTESPKMFMTQGGIWPAIWGTILLTFWTALFSLPIGIMAGIFLAEYAPRGAFTRVISSPR